MKKILIRLLALAIVGAAAWAGYRFVRQFEQKQGPVPTATVRKGDVIIRSYTRGELRAVRSLSLVAPNLFGTVQITRLAPLGAVAREKDLIVEFDDSEVRSRLDEKQLELEQLDEQLRKAQADQEIRNNQDQVELLRDRFAVRRAELEVKRNELLSEIDAKKNKLNLDEAQRRLKQLESDIKSRLAQSQAELAVLRENKNRALLELQREKARLSQVKLLAPMAGLVAIRQNRGMFMMRGMQLPDLREGDQVWPGLPVADVLDLSELEVAAKVGELDRANLHEGQEASIRLDAVPNKVFHGRIKTLSGTATANIWSGDPAKKFDVVFSVDMKELLSGLGARADQIRRMLEIAERNRNRPVVAMPMLAMSMPGEAMSGAFTPGGPASAGGGSGEGRAPAAAAPAAQSSERGQRGSSHASPEQQQKMREEFQKALGGRNPQDLTPEERQKIRGQIRAQAPGGGSEAGGGRRGGSEAGGQRGGGSDAGGGGGAARGFGIGARSQFSQQDLDNADLPPPPDKDSQLEVLLRPGLLSDVEIIVEKVPDAIHIPAQAVFEKDGKPIVYVKSGSTFDERSIQPVKRSESTIIIGAGVKPGEQVALSDPFRKAGKKGEKLPGKQPAVPSSTTGGGRQGS